jgi:DNA-binding transcriptional LysR family regulator
MTVAANLLHMTQGAVSQRVKRLEDELDCLLFVRKTRRLELTRHGEQFLVKARRLLRLNDEIWTDMTGRSLHGSLRVGVPYDLVTPHAPVMKAFADAHPKVEISLVCVTSAELSEAVTGGRLDVSLVEYVASEAIGEVIRVEPLVWSRRMAVTRLGSGHYRCRWWMSAARFVRWCSVRSRMRASHGARCLRAATSKL